MNNNLLNKDLLSKLNTLSPVIKEAIVDGQLDVESLPETLKVQLRDMLLNSLTKKARDNFETYVELMAPEILPEGFIPGRHIRILAKHLQKIEESIVDTYTKQRKKEKAKAKRAQYFLPPGGMKSKLISILFVTWFMGRHPQWPILQLGHSTKFCIDNFGRQVLEVLFTDKFKSIFPSEDCRVKRTARSAQSFQLVGGGKYYTTGAGSKIAGRRAALLLSDDVVSEQEAYSNSVRNKINEWYIPGARSRLLPYGAEVIVNTRWHVEDLSGFLQKKDEASPNPWEVIKFPAILDDKSAKMLGLKEGESFWPELWPVEIFIEAKRTMAPSKFNSMYQQNPVPDEGNIVKEEWWQEWEEEEDPMVEIVIASLDTAFSEKERADYSAYTVWGVFFSREVGRNGFSYVAANTILLGAQKGRWSFPELCEKAQFIKDTWEPDYFLIEKKASGQSLIQELRLKQYSVVEYMPDRDKIARAHACVNSFITKRIWYPVSQAWAKDVISEVSQFPAGAHDDLADTVWQVIIWMRQQVFIPNEGEIGYEDQLEEDGNGPRRKQRALTYWGAVSGNR